MWKKLNGKRGVLIIYKRQTSMYQLTYFFEVLSDNGMTKEQLKWSTTRELSVAQLVRFLLMVEPVHHDFNLQLSIGACIFQTYFTILLTQFFQWQVDIARQCCVCVCRVTCVRVFERLHMHCDLKKVHHPKLLLSCFFHVHPLTVLICFFNTSFISYKQMLHLFPTRSNIYMSICNE